MIGLNVTRRAVSSFGPALAAGVFLAAGSGGLVGCASSGQSAAVDGDGGASGRRVLLVVTNHGRLGDEAGRPTGFYLSEAAHPWVVFKEHGYGVTLASPDGGSAPMDPRSVAEADTEGRKFLERFAEDGAVKNTVWLGSIDPSNYDAIFFAGGHGTMWDFPTSAHVREVTEEIYRDGGVVAAVCHGPAALIDVREPGGEHLLAGARATAFTNAEEDAVGLSRVMPFLLETRMRERGAQFSGAANFAENVVVDGKLVTGQNPASARGAAERVVELIESRPVRRE